ncbi:MAG: hypothetical protein ACRD0L_02875 [Acidimicrobiales bacterium]
MQPRPRPQVAAGPPHFRRRYGSSPFHLLAILAGYAISGYAISRWFFGVRAALSILIWFVAAGVAHDLVVLPLYSLLSGLVGRSPAVPGPSAWWRNHVRVPAGLSLLLLVIYFPLIAGLGAHTYLRITGMTDSVYLGRWAVITGILFALSALVLGLRVARRRPAAPG